MTPLDRPLFAQLLTRLGLLYNAPISTALLDIYWHTLVPFDMTAIKMALQSHITHPDAGRYLPKPADVIRYLQGSHSERAIHAWSQVTAAIHSFGSYCSLTFDDPLVHAVITDMGGWVHLCETPQRALDYRAREFEKRYTAYLCHPPLHYPKALRGRFATQTASCHNEPPLLVGDPYRAKEVYEQGQESPKVLYPIKKN